jgi:hypothetical protein
VLCFCASKSADFALFCAANSKICAFFSQNAKVCAFFCEKVFNDRKKMLKLAHFAQNSAKFCSFLHRTRKICAKILRCFARFCAISNDFAKMRKNSAKH